MTSHPAEAWPSSTRDAQALLTGFLVDSLAKEGVEFTRRGPKGGRFQELGTSLGGERLGVLETEIKKVGAVFVMELWVGLRDLRVDGVISSLTQGVWGRKHTPWCVRAHTSPGDYRGPLDRPAVMSSTAKSEVPPEFLAEVKRWAAGRVGVAGFARLGREYAEHLTTVVVPWYRRCSSDEGLIQSLCDEPRSLRPITHASYVLPIVCHLAGRCREAMEFFHQDLAGAGVSVYGTGPAQEAHDQFVEAFPAYCSQRSANVR